MSFHRVASLAVLLTVLTGLHVGTLQAGDDVEPIYREEYGDPPAPTRTT